MKGILEEGKSMMEELEQSSTLDAALIAAAQKVEHYEIASYGTVRAYAEQLNFTKAAELLQETLEEESSANETLNELAVNVINIQAEEVEQEKED